MESETYISEKERKDVEKWLLTPEAAQKLGKGFEKGAKFVPILGDGNCMFNACSVHLTSTKND